MILALGMLHVLKKDFRLHPSPTQLNKIQYRLVYIQPTTLQDIHKK